jgi:hypothetical protein
MTASHARRPAAPPRPAAPVTAELMGLIAKRSPKTSLSQIEILSRATGAAAAEIAKLTADQQRRLVARRGALRDLLVKVADAPDEAATPGERIALAPSGPVEVNQGEGLGEPLSPEEAQRRIQAYTAPVTLENWAGPTAGPVEVSDKLRVSRSTLHAWQARGLVIGLLNGVRKNVFPLEQFVDGRPAAGLGDVLTVIGQPSVTWRWLKEPNPLLNGAPPLTRLKRGHLEEVLRAAQTNFGQ